MNLRALATTIVLAVAFSTTGTRALAQTVETGFLDRALRLYGVEYRYQVYVPREFRRSTTWPVILAPHGGGEYGNDGIRQTEGGSVRAIRHRPERFPALVVFPQSHADNTPDGQLKGGEAALAAMDKTVAEFNCDPSRDYPTGYSTRGNGSRYLASRHPERSAALVVVCGFILEF